jgi:hypothetical protein
MEAIVIVAIIVGAVVFLAYRARPKVGYRDLESDVRGQGELRRRPVSGGLNRIGQLGNDLLDDRTGDAGVRPRED